MFSSTSGLSEISESLYRKAIDYPSFPLKPLGKTPKPEKSDSRESLQFLLNRSRGSTQRSFMPIRWRWRAHMTTRKNDNHPAIQFLKALNQNCDTEGFIDFRF